MWTHTEFVDFFETLARKNRLIAHTALESHYVCIVPVYDPYNVKGLNVDQYVNDRRSKLHMPAFIFETPVHTLRDPGDAVTSTDALAFIIMDKPTDETYAQRKVCITKTEGIARQVVAYIKKYFLKSQTCPENITFSLAQTMYDTIQDGNYWGTKVSLRFTSGAGEEHTYDATKWDENA